MILMALSVLVTCCGDDSDTVVITCFIDDFEGGEFSFTVTGAEDRCAGGLLVILIPQRTYGPVLIPSTEVLRENPEVELDLPIVGLITVNVTVDEDMFRINTTAPVTVDLEDVPTPLGPVDVTVTGTVRGTLCPTSGIRIAAGFTLTIQSIVPEAFDVPCNITISAIGNAESPSAPCPCPFSVPVPGLFSFLYLAARYLYSGSRSRRC
jgi:hypothetical protein